jgi:hypothetical protein
MRITLEIPDDLVPTLAAPGRDPYRGGRLTAYQLRTLLGIPSRYQLDGFLKEHKVYDYTVEDFENYLASLRELRDKQKAGHPA